MIAAVAFHQCLYYLQLEVGGGEAVIVLLNDMHDELATEATDSHGDDV